MLKEYKNNQIPLITLMLVLSIAATKKKKKKDCYLLATSNANISENSATDW